MLTQRGDYETPEMTIHQEDSGMFSKRKSRQKVAKSFAGQNVTEIVEKMRLNKDKFVMRSHFKGRNKFSIKTTNFGRYPESRNPTGGEEM